MINKYGLINHFDKTNAYLTILFDDLDNSIIPQQDEDILLYFKDEKIVRVDIFRLNKYVKIKFKGLIALPNFELIAILNGYLGKYNYLLANKDYSGFYFAYEDNKMLVKVKKDTLIADGTFVKEERVATHYDLDVSYDKESIVLDNSDNQEDLINRDIFQMEEKNL